MSSRFIMGIGYLLPFRFAFIAVMRRSRVGTGVPDSSTPENHKNIGFLSNTGQDPLKTHKATKPAFNDALSSARHLNGVSRVGR